MYKLALKSSLRKALAMKILSHTEKHPILLLEVRMAVAPREAGA